MKDVSTTLAFSLVLAVLVIVGFGAALRTYAQVVHPCDTGAPVSQTVSSAAPHRAQFCAKPSESPEALTVYINSTASDLRPLTVVQAPNPSGFALYEGPLDLQFARGSYVVQVTVWNTPFPGSAAQESGKSNPLSLSVVDEQPPPTAPLLKGVIR